MIDAKTNNWALPLAVLAVVGATIYLSIRNNQTDVVYSLCTAIFGYYFGVKSSVNTKTP